MAGRRALPDLVTRVLVDDTQLRRVGSTATGAGASIKQGLDQSGTPAIQRAEAAYKRLSTASLSTTTVVSKGLQTATQYTTTYGSALTKQEARYATLQLKQLGVTEGERDLAREGSSAARALGSMGEQGAATIERFSSLAGVMGSAGPLGLAIGAATVGFSLLVAGAEDGENKYLALADQVEAYSRVSGESAEQSSRQVIALQDLGVSAQTAQTGFFRLGKVISEHPEKLDKLGIAIAYTDSGQVDLNATLMNAIDVYNRTGDAATRSQILFQAFGRAGQDMLPIFIAGTQRLKQLEDQVNLVFTDKNLQDARKYAIEQNLLKEQVNELQMGYGNFATGPQRAATEEMLASTYASQKLEAHFKGQAYTMRGQLSPAARELQQQYHDQYLQSLNAQVGAQGLTSALKAQSDAAAELDKQNQQLYTDDLALFSAQTASDRANQAVLTSADKVTQLHIDDARAKLDLTDKTKALKDAIAQYGKNSEEAAKADLDLQQAQLKVHDSAVALQGSIDDQRDTYLTAATDAADLAEKVADLSGNSFTAADKAEAFRKKLGELEQGLAPNSPLRKALDAYIAQLQNIPKDVTTNVTDVISTSTVTAGKGKGSARQYGGPVQPNRDYIVGERGPEILRMGPSGGGMVYPNGVQPPSPTTPSSVVNNVTLNGAGMSAWDVSRELAWMFKRGLR